MDAIYSTKWLSLLALVAICTLVQGSYVAYGDGFSSGKAQECSCRQGEGCECRRGQGGGEGKNPGCPTMAGTGMMNKRFAEGGDADRGERGGGTGGGMTGGSGSRRVEGTGDCECPKMAAKGSAGDAIAEDGSRGASDDRERGSGNAEAPRSRGCQKAPAATETPPVETPPAPSIEDPAAMSALEIPGTPELRIDSTPDSNP